MREIEFRAYDKEHKRMRTVEEMSFTPEGYIRGVLSGKGKDQLGRVYLGEPVTVDPDNPNHPGGWVEDYPLIQYIGVRFGEKKVYEGSIIRWMADDGDCFRGLVEFVNEPPEGSLFLSGFRVTNIVNITDEVTDEEGSMLPGWNGEPEVIGHILESPELLPERV